MSTYLRLFFLPVNQNLDYDYPVFPDVPYRDVILSIFLILILLSAATYITARSRKTSPLLRLVAFGIFWFFITIATESSLIPIADVIFEHRLYLPSFGLIVALVSGITYVYEMRYSQIKILLLAVFVGIFAVATYTRNAVWRDTITVWSDVVQKSPNKVRGHDNLGKAAIAKSDYATAISHLQWVLSVAPDDYIAHNNIGVAYKNSEMLENAVAHFRIATGLKPDFVDAHFNLAISYLQMEEIKPSLAELETTLQLDPAHPQAAQFIRYIFSNYQSSP